MTDLKDILISGKAPNSDDNASTADAKNMQRYFSGLVAGTDSEIHELVINTTVAGAMGSAEYIPIDDVEPEPEDGMDFYYHLKVSSPALEERLWCVASFLAAVEVRGLEVATRDYLTELDPTFDYLKIPYVYEAIEGSLTDLYKDSDES